jgi:hypothetical protein
MSTLGFATGLDEQDRKVRFAGDWRPMRDLGLAIAAGSIEDPIEVEIESWQILEVSK